jgi:hypothetical protein
MKQILISSNAVAVRFDVSSLMIERCPNKSPLLDSFTIESLPFALSFVSLQKPSFMQYTPLRLSPSEKIISPFFTKK